MKKTAVIVFFCLMLIFSAVSCKPADRDSGADDNSVNLIKDMDHYLSFDEGYVDVDTTELELAKDGKVVSMLSFDPDWTNGITITFATEAHEKPVSINYDGYGCLVTYYEYPSKKSLFFTDVYYNEEEGDWDGMVKFVKEETYYYENGQIEKRIVRDIDEDETTGVQSIYIVSEEYFDEDGNAVDKTE